MMGRPKRTELVQTVNKAQVSLKVIKSLYQLDLVSIVKGFGRQVHQKQKWVRANKPT